MCFVVCNRTDLSINDLRELRRRGYSVMKTPHVGNVYTNNLIMADAGVHMNFYDRTIGERDRNFHPHRVIVGGTPELITCGTKLTTHARVQRASRRINSFTEGRLVTECHMEAMRNAMPHADCVTYTDYLRSHADLVLAVLESVTREDPSVWEFQVTLAGDRVPCRVTSWESLLALGIYGLTNDMCGAVLPNVLNILVDTIVEAQATGHTEVYHLSGPDMVRYIDGLLGKLKILYAHVRHALALPGTLTLNLVPVANIRLAGDAMHQAEINELVEAWLGLGQGNKERAQRIKGASNDSRKAIIAACAGEKDRDSLRLRSAAVSAEPVFYDIARANCFTQHDIVSGGRTFFTHPWALEAPIKDIDLLIAEATRQREFAARLSS